MLISDLITNYLKYSKATKRNGTYQYECTIAKYLISYLKYNKIKVLSLAKLQELIIYLKETTELSNNSINKVIKLLRNILSFHNIYFDWLTNYKLLRETKNRFNTISENELKLIFNYVDNLENKGNANQYQMMIYLLYDTGIRQSKLLQIKLHDINLEKNHIIIRASKSIEDRAVFLSNDMHKRLSDYKPIANNDGFLFYNHLRDRCFNRNDLKLFYRRIKKATKIDRLHSHMFRHTYATDLIELDVPLFVVQKQLGHASIKTTEIYYHSSIKFQKNHMEKISNLR